MICAEKVTKIFQTANMKQPFVALNELTCTIPSGCIYGLIGANGAGKSTLMRLIAGVYRADGGTLTVDGQPIWENPAAKAKVVYIPDDLYFLPQSTLYRMAQLYNSLYPHFSWDRYKELVKTFGLNDRVSMGGFSKGMRRQAATVLGLSTMPDYLLFDETFDGLDPVMRKLVKDVIYSDILERGTTTIITSHSLRELEDTCDQLALLHHGGIVFASELQNLRTAMCKVQLAFSEPFGRERFADLNYLSYEQQGSVCTLILRGERELIEARLRAMKPLICDFLPLNLEEIFIYETEALGYRFGERGGDGI